MRLDGEVTWRVTPELTPDEVLKPGTGLDTGCLKASRLEWCWIQTAQRLADQHGPADALARLNGYGT